MYGHAPAATSFSTLIVASVDLACIWINAIPAGVVAVLDGVASILLLAGGIVGLHRVSSMKSFSADL